MYCPKCGQQASDKVSFCTGCGFRLITVKQLVTDDGLPESGQEKPSENPLLLRRKDLNLGALLMYAGALLSLFVAIFYGGARDGSIADVFSGISAVIWGFFANAVVFALLLFGFRFSSRQKDMSFGATLMFICSILANFFVPTLLWNDSGMDFLFVTGYMELLIVTVAFILILLLGQPLMQRLMQKLSDIFAEDRQSAESTARLKNRTVDEIRLPAGEPNVGVSNVKPDVNTAPMRQPSLVTEEETRLLKMDS